MKHLILVDFVVGLLDGTVRVFIKQENQTLQLQCHNDRILSLEFHPSGRFLLTSSFDSMIKLWDLNDGMCVIEQTGHVGAIRTVKWQCDGGLFASGGNDKIVHIFDVRCGKQICQLEGHSSTITTLDWHRNGGVICSGSDDNTIRLWDLRMQKCGFTIPAHNEMITSLRFHSNGTQLLSSSFDHSIKLWDISNTQWKLLNHSQYHSHPVTCVDWFDDCNGFISCGFDKTWKLYHSSSSD